MTPGATAGPSRDATDEGTPAVVIPTGRQMKSYGCMRSLHRSGIETIVASERGRIPHFSSRYCSERVRLPSPWTDLLGYRDGLLDLASRPEVRTIVPVRECDVYLFARYADAFDAHVSLVVPSMASLERGHDRVELAAAAEAAGVPYARTEPLSTAADWNDDAVVKSRYNVLTDAYCPRFDDGEVAEVNHIRFLPAEESPDTRALQEEFRHEPIVQEFIPEADKHLYCALWDDGEPLATYQHRQIRKVSWVGGGGVYRKSAFSGEVDEVATRLLEELEWSGFACIEYIKDAETGEWKFLELNPRVWLSLPEAVRAGVDFPAFYWRRASGDTGPFDDAYPIGTPCHVSYGELKHLLSTRSDESPFLEPPSIGRRAIEIAVSCLRDRRFDYLRADDPRFVAAAVRGLLRMETNKGYATADSNADETPD